MHSTRVWGTLITVVCVLGLGGTAHAQLPKQGTYTGVFGWHANVTGKELTGSKDTYSFGEINGAFFNDAGSGFLHNTSVICPVAGATISGTTFFQGNCILTDQNRDKAILVWKCAFKAEGRCPGNFEWIAGTGKYKGITGNNAFHSGFIHQGPQGYSVWKGQWQLP
jgi:hypothetical protein